MRRRPYGDDTRDETQPETPQQPYTVDGQYEEADGYAEEEYSAYDEELDNEHRFHIAMNVFNMVSVLAGLLVILLLVAMLIGLISWLSNDITHSFTLWQSTIQ